MWICVLELPKSGVTICSVMVEDFSACLFLLLAASANQETARSLHVSLRPTISYSSSSPLPQQATELRHFGQPHKNTFRLSQITDFSAESTSCPSKKTDKPESPGSANHDSIRISLSFKPLTKQTPDYNIRFLAVAEGTDPPWQQQHLCMVRT